MGKLDTHNPLSMKKYFYHTKTERLGAVILIMICLFATLFPLLLPTFFPKQATDFSTFQADIALFRSAQEPDKQKEKVLQLFAFDPNAATKEELMELGLSKRTAQTFINFRNKIGGFNSIEDVQKVYGLQPEDFERLRPFMRLRTEGTKAIASTRISKKQPVTLFFFNPNLATAADFQQLGLSNKVARTIVNYRAKGGTFRKKEDLKKIYGLSESDYIRLVDYIDLPEVIESKEEALVEQETESSSAENFIPTSYENVSNELIIDINQADAEEWMKLRGIGVTFSKRIVRFREALGGFTSIEQIAETYNLPDSTFQNIKDQLISSPILEFIKINEVDAATLKAHPYFSWNEANAIVNYRKQHGSYKSIDDLREVKILSNEFIQKIQPYIQF